MTTNIVMSVLFLRCITFTALFLLAACSGMRLSTQSHGPAPAQYFLRNSELPAGATQLDIKQMNKALLRSTNALQNGRYLFLEAIPLTAPLLLARGESPEAIAARGDAACFEINIRSRSNNLGSIPDWYGEVNLTNGEKIPGKFQAPKIKSSQSGYSNGEEARLYTAHSIFCTDRAVSLSSDFRLGIQAKHEPNFPAVELSWELRP